MRCAIEVCDAPAADGSPTCAKHESWAFVFERRRRLLPTRSEVVTAMWAGALLGIAVNHGVLLTLLLVALLVLTVVVGRSL